MKKHKVFCILFAVLAVLLSDVMCILVAVEYCRLLWCISCSAPASTAFYLAIPFLIGIVACAALAVFFHKRQIK